MPIQNTLQKKSLSLAVLNINISYSHILQKV